jgi:hypothetical protein
MQVSNSSECRNDIALHGGWDTHSSALGLQTQQQEKRNKIATKITAILYPL